MKQILAISITMLLIAIGYICYNQYNKNMEVAYYLGGVDERATSASLILLAKKQKTLNFKEHMQSMIIFDLQVLNKNNKIKSKLNLKRYCDSIIYIKNDLYDFNSSSEKLINKLCKKKTL